MNAHDEPLTAREIVLGVFAIAAPIVGMAAVAFALSVLGGCGSTSSGMRLVVSSASVYNIADVNWEEYKWPVLSVITGPKTTLWVNRSFPYLSSISAEGCVTNTTTALGIFDSREEKSTRIDLTFAQTNGVTSVEM